MLPNGMQLQIESFELFAEFFADVAGGRRSTARNKHFSRNDAPENEISQALDAPGLCTEFVLWATEESVLL